jgi:hypothetical protein
MGTKKETPCVAIFISNWQYVMFLFLSFMFFLLQNQRTGGRNRFCLGRGGGRLAMIGVGWWWGKG